MLRISHTIIHFTTYLSGNNSSASPYLSAWCHIHPCFRCCWHRSHDTNVKRLSRHRTMLSHKHYAAAVASASVAAAWRALRVLTCENTFADTIRQRLISSECADRTTDCRSRLCDWCDAMRCGAGVLWWFWFIFSYEQRAKESAYEKPYHIVFAAHFGLFFVCVLPSGNYYCEFTKKSSSHFATHNTTQKASLSAYIWHTIWRSVRCRNVNLDLCTFDYKS